METVRVRLPVETEATFRLIVSVPVPGGGAETVTVTGAEVEPENAAEFVGMNCAVIECEATESVLVEIEATPLATAAVPSEVVPSKNCTEPAASFFAVSAAVTVADRVTLSPWVAAVGVAVSAVVVATVAGGGPATRL